MNFRQLSWLAPFLCLGLIALVLLRPWPVFPPPVHSYIVTDAAGDKIAVPLPFRGVVGGGRQNEFGGAMLSTTHAPQVLVKMGGPHDRTIFAEKLISRIYPQLVKNDNLWDTPFDIESILAHDNGNVYLSYWSTTKAQQQRLGLATLLIGPEWLLDHDFWRAVDNYIDTQVHVENAAIGHPERAQAFIDGYREAYDDLKRDLQVETLNEWPRYSEGVSSAKDWSRLSLSGSPEEQHIGLIDATKGFRAKGRETDAERVLAMNPDLIVLNGGGVDFFLHDPRWQGLKAVQSRHVYGGVAALRSGFDIDNYPIVSRWLAEIAHPGRIQPQLREIMREHYLKAYGYCLSDDEIDKMLKVEDNKNAAGYARFLRKDLSGGKQGSSH